MAIFGTSPNIPCSSSLCVSHSPTLRLAPVKVKSGRLRNFSVCAAASTVDESVVTLLDYGAGNVRSIRNAIRFLGCNIKEVQEPEDILNAKRLIFPGVGAFAAAMDVLIRKGGIGMFYSLQITGWPKHFVITLSKIAPFWAFVLVCSYFESSEENGPVKGLGLIPGIVGRFDSSNGCQVPHIGWNAISTAHSTGILDDIGSRHVYFVHSYRAIPSAENKEWVSSTCNYGSDFIASVRRGNVHAVQFHPEKSGDAGLSVLRRFLFPDSVTREMQIKGAASSLAKRVIACLDVSANDKGDLVVTKVDQYDVRQHDNENEVRNLGKPVDLAREYYEAGADEISFLNITGFHDFPLGDILMLQVLRYASENVFVPLTVGGGIREFIDWNGKYYSSLDVASEYFRSGADKVSIGSDAVKTGKSSIEQISRVYGNQAVVISIDPRRVYVKDPSDVGFRSIRVTKPGPNGEAYAWYQCTVNGGREGRPIGAYELAKAVEELGAGISPTLLFAQNLHILNEYLELSSGQGKGFDIDLIKLVSDAVNIPVIASSGAGAVQHFSEVFFRTTASAALAAGIFHRKEVPIESVKKHLLDEGIEVRMQ